jgi:hypothetical protein
LSIVIPKTHITQLNKLEVQMPEDTKAASKIAVQDIVAAAAQGALRGIEARKIGADELIRSGFFVNIHIICGGYPLQFLNPQPLPPAPVQAPSR